MKEIGRILRSSTRGFTFGSREKLLHLPYFGALVKAQTNPKECVYGLLYNINVDDDPLVQRLVLSENLKKSVIEDQRSNRLLPVEMSVLAIGQQRAGKTTWGLPPRPPLNLDPVYLVDDVDEIAAVTRSLSYLRLVLGSAESGIPVDQLLVAHIRSVYELRGADDAWALGVIQEIIELLRSNYETLMPTLEALSEALPVLPILDI